MSDDNGAGASRLRPDAAAVNRLVKMFTESMLNRTDYVAHRAKWKSDCPLEAGDQLHDLLLSHLGCLPRNKTIKAKWVSFTKKEEGEAKSPFRIGTYSPDLEGNTRFACLDFDGGGQGSNHKNPLADPLAAALHVRQTLHDAGLACHLEKSKSGSGWHIWCLFADKAPAAVVRRVLFSLLPDDLPLASGGCASPRKNIGVELFPKQDSLVNTVAKLGNQVYLPMWHGVQKPNNWFHQVNDAGEVKPYLPDSLARIPVLALHALDPGEKPSPSSPLRGRANTGPEARERCIEYLRRCDPAVSGKGGHNSLMWAARIAVWGFALGKDAGYEVLREVYDPVCDPPWSETELRHKCADADLQGGFSKPRGWLLNEEKRPGRAATGHGAKRLPRQRRRIAAKRPGAEKRRLAGNRKC